MSKHGKKTGFGKIVLIVIIIVAILGVAFKFLVYDKLEQKAVEKVGEQMIYQMVEESGYTIDQNQVEQILNSVSEEDKEKVKDIVMDSVGISEIPDALSLVKNKDIEGLKEFAKSKLSDEQINALYGIYEKYR